MTSSGIFLKSAYKTPANFNEFGGAKTVAYANPAATVCSIAAASACVTQFVLQSVW
jgi:hypothetical protein